MKFGGTSVADRDRHDHVAGLVAGVNQDAVVVVSAMGGTTDALLRAGALAEAGDLEGAQAEAYAIETRHLAAADEGPEADHVRAVIAELKGLLHGVSLLGEQTPRSRATLAAFGERLNAPLVAARLTAAGRPAVGVDARTLLVTDATHESARVDMEASRARAERLRSLVSQGLTPVVTGFIGATPDGVTTVLGRGGSDYSAALFGNLVDADEVWIWTDVPGILTADPRLVRDARVLEQVSYREAAEMSYFGAKVVHPKTMLPAMDRGIPIRIRSTFDPAHPGTTIAADTVDVAHGVKNVTHVSGLVLITLEGRGMAGIVGVARRIFGATESAGANVLMISQASSEQTVSLVVHERDAAGLLDVLHTEFGLELEASLLEPIQVKRDVAVVSIIGEGMSGRAGISADLFGALGFTGVNVLAIAQGGSEMSISVAIDAPDAGRAVRAIHTRFGLRKQVEVFLLGATGRVGGALLEMLGGAQGDALRILGAGNSRHLVLDGAGIAPADVVARLRASDEAMPGPADLVARLDQERSSELIVVDLTAAELADLHRQALEAGFHVVTANKKPIAGSLAAYQRLVDAVRRTGARYGYETTFGAGLPVLHTLKELVSTGDTLHSVSGCFSGTLGFLCTRLQEGTPLAEAVQEAADLGYTEPDPREDLSGRDVARKALIIARAMGLRLEPSDVSLEAMVPDLEDGLEQALAQHGGSLAARIADAGARDAVLRYVAEITPAGVSVGLREVPATSAIGSLTGPDNILVFRTGRYAQYPLVVRGPGAGAEVTAAGVLGDLLRVASR
jgi:aspartokinase/homoserine dehydrogenase 1